MKTAEAPNSAIAGDLAAAAVGRPPIAVRRFDTGLRHYVFEATFDDRAPVVVRIAADHSRSAMAGALELSRLLRPRGVPLPEVIAEGLTHQFSHLVLERLPGTDLGDVIRGLSDSSVEVIAAKVAQAQRITAKTASARRYGYGVDPTDAPHESWSQVLQDNLTRSRKRITAAKLFGQDVVDAVTKLVSEASVELDALAPIPFLHDTTTKNVIVTAGGTFSGIVDVDDLCFGDPRYVDLGVADGVRRTAPLCRCVDEGGQLPRRPDIPALRRSVPRRLHVRTWPSFQPQPAALIGR